MTREEKEHIGKYVLELAKLLEDGCYQQEILLGAAHIIDEALEQEPTTKNDLGVDCILRADAIHAVSEALERTFVENEDIAKMIINKLPSVTPQKPILDKIIAEIKALSPEPTAYDVVDGNPIKDAVWETLADVLMIIDKYKAESEN